MTKICGIDEAGRGPVIGPMVMAGVVVKDDKALMAMGVKDSKMLTPLQRERLYDKIIEVADSYMVLIIEPDEIDNAVNSKVLNLNRLEAVKTAEILNSLKPDKAFIDCPSTNIKAYSSYLKKMLKYGINILAAHKADVKYPVVSAASILAKVTRDREIEKLKKQYKVEFGSGYPSDPRTVEFLKKNYSKFPFFRKSWQSFKNTAESRNQKSLLGY